MTGLLLYLRALLRRPARWRRVGAIDEPTLYVPIEHRHGHVIRAHVRRGAHRNGIGRP